jgi:hypothetical protein
LMARINLNTRLIRDAKHRDFVSYLKELRQDHSDVAICQALFEAVDHGHVSPNLFGVFLRWSKCPDTIALCIQDGPSRFIRMQGIKQFGRALIDPVKWELAWTAVGRTERIVKLMAKISVSEVTALVKAIGACNRGQHKPRAREEAIEELVHALLPFHYPGSRFRSQDERPIQDRYAQMVPACSPAFVGQLLDSKDQSNPLYRLLPAGRLIKSHGELLRKRIIKGIVGDGQVEADLRQYLATFIYKQPPKPGPDSKVSSSMLFATKVLQFRLDNVEKDIGWLTGISDVDVLFSLLRRSIRRRLPETKKRDIIVLGLQLLEVKPSIKSALQSRGLWSKLLVRWKRAPELYEDSFVLALRLGLGGSQNSICRDFLQTSRTLRAKPELRWPLLRRYCLHVPNKGIDIDEDVDFKPLAKQQWSSDVFEYLSKEEAVRLLKGLQSANPQYSFLRAMGGTSILSNQDIISQQNFNVALLLTLLQRDSGAIQTKAQTGVDELRKKAATAREQADRAHFAKAASAYAIASGSLDLYEETITWLQRYVRDPLTLKVVFGRDAVLTSEGIELLSGIPQPLMEDNALANISSGVEQANRILINFHETMLLAKREPSFYQPDWSGVFSLFGSAISRRVSRAEELQKRLEGPEAEVYSAIWDGTLAMLEKVNVEFLNEAYGPIKSLLNKLPPNALAKTTKILLDTGTEKRKKQDRQPGDDTLERLSYEMLLKLATGDKPELAQKLVLQTILDRPDASSWHRQLLSIPFLKSLSSKDAHDMLLAFATAIGEKLEEQSYVNVGEAQPPKPAPPQSLVKVTTVKYLAQLLDNAEFISEEAAVEVLVELFKAGTHRDIRLATLDSLLSLLHNLCNGADENWKSNTLVQKIMEALDTVIPVVGSINERRPLQPEDWEEARVAGTLPEISDISAGLPPIMSAVFRAPVEYPRLKYMQAEFVSRYLLPIYEHSQAEHRKWVVLFLAKHKANIKADDLPSPPVSPQVWNTLVERHPNLIPQTVLEEFNKYMMMSIAPPPALNEFNKSLRKDTELSNTLEVRHWLAVFDQTMDQYSSSGTQILVPLVNRDWPSHSIRNGITFTQVEDMVLTHASLFLDEYEKYRDIWNSMVDDLCPPSKSAFPREDSNSMRSKLDSWQKHGRIVLQKLITLVLERKTKGEIKRSILPSTTKLQLWLLPYPCFPDPAEVDGQCIIFVRELEELLITLLQGDFNVLRWPKIAEDAFTVSKLLNTDEERLRVASLNGSLRGERDQISSALNLVRVGLAMKLIDDGRGWLRKTGKGPLPQEMKAMAQGLKMRVEEWQSNSDEGIREKVADWKRDRKDLWKTLMSEE